MKLSRVSPIVTLTTDFGLVDHYVGTLKGVLLSLCPDARLVDISHEIAPYSIYSGAYTIDQAAPYFPSGTVHLVVVDPGVGTSRKPVLMEALGQYFIAPDNGVLAMIGTRDGRPRLREIANRDLWLEAPSATFHGRDVFAPVAAAIASGQATPEEVGPALTRWELLPDLDPHPVGEGRWRGKLLSVDRFGNAITNFKASEFVAVASSNFALHMGNREITEFRATFGSGAPDLCFAYFGSSGYIEVGMNQRSAAAFLEVSPGDSIGLRW